MSNTLHYQDLMDRIFDSPCFRHRTLRTVFDPGSHEWNQTTMEEKIALIKKILENKLSIEFILAHYEMHYREEGRDDIARNAKRGLAHILQYAINPPDPGTKTKEES